MPAITAENVMTRAALSVGPESSLLDVMRLFVEENIHGAPVVDGEGKLLGVISTSDLLQAQEDERDTMLGTADYLRGVLEFSAPGWSGGSSDFQDRLAQRTVAEVMTKSFVGVSRDTPVAEVARSMRENRIHRVWVHDGDYLCGVISALDLMPVVEELAKG